MTSGASIPCTTSPTPLRTRWKGYHPFPVFPGVWRPTGPSTTGLLTTATCPPSPGRSNLPVWASTTRSCPSASCAPWWKTARWPVGTIPGCPPFGGLRRRGLHPRFYPQFLRAHRRGQVRFHGWNMRFLEHCLREDLNENGPPGSGSAAAPSNWSSPTIPRAKPRPSPWRTTPTTPARRQP